MAPRQPWQIQRDRLYERARDGCPDCKARWYFWQVNIRVIFDCGATFHVPYNQPLTQTVQCLKTHRNAGVV